MFSGEVDVAFVSFCSGRKEGNCLEARGFVLMFVTMVLFKLFNATKKNHISYEMFYMNDKKCAVTFYTTQFFLINIKSYAKF